MENKIVFNFFDKHDTIKSLCKLYNLDWNEVVKFIYDHDNIDCLTYDFIKYFNINLDAYNVDQVFLRCKHVTTSFDNLESLRRWGLLTLDKALLYETTLSGFLLEHDIKINVTDKYMIFNNTKVNLFEYHEDCRECIYGECKYIRRKFDGNHDISYKNTWCDFRSSLIPLIVKLYSHKSEIEVHLAGNDDTIINYSCVKQYPEIFVTIQEMLYKLYREKPPLIRDWTHKENRKTFVLHFDECISSFECINSSSFLGSTYYYSEVAELCGKTLDDLELGDINDCFYSNYYLINTSIRIILDNCRELYGQILPDVKIGWDNIFAQPV